MNNPEMLAFTYRLNKIIRDMRHAALPNEDEAAKRDAAVEMIKDVCDRLERDFA